MKITVEFDSEEEFKARIKNPRGGKSSEDGDTGQAGTAPQPLMPPAGGFTGPGAQTGFPGGGAAPGGFPGSGAVGIDPALQNVVNRVVTKLDASLAAGASNPEAALTWFRSHFGPEGSQATLDQIKTMFLPRLPVAKLEEIAKAMGA
jgi:hypothetical protein